MCGKPTHQVDASSLQVVPTETHEIAEERDDLNLRLQVLAATSRELLAALDDGDAAQLAEAKSRLWGALGRVAHG